MITINIRKTKNLKHVLNSFESGQRGVLLEGGSRSGKTWAVCQFIIYQMLVRENIIVTVSRDHLATIKDTIWQDLEEVLTLMGVIHLFDVSEHKSRIKYKNNVIRCVGLNDKLIKVHGMKQNIFWINETMGVSKDSFDQLEQRTSDFWILDYNPMYTEHWTYDLELRPDVSLLKTTVLDNEFAPEASKNKILSYEPTERNKLLGTADPYKWSVYGLGERAASEEVIYQNWQLFTEGPKEYDLRVFGLDFGYSNDPTAIVEVIFNGNNVYLIEHCYSTGLTNPDIADLLKGLDTLNCYVICDSAEPKSITELRILGINAIPCKKGQGSITWGIDKVKSKKLHVHAQSDNLIKELRNYKWKKDRRTNRVLNLPEDKYNHLLDAVRYGLTKFAA